MQSLTSCVQRLALCGKLTMNNQLLISNVGRVLGAPQSSHIHTSLPIQGSWLDYTKGPQKWLKHNRTIFPPQSPDEERRPAYVCHMKTNIRYSPKKMWYIACFVRGMSVDEAVKQLNFVLKKGGAIVKETILEAQQLAVEKHNVEFKSNLWVAESFYGKGVVYKGFRRHAKMRAGEIRYIHSHYFVRLEEGKPPANYYLNVPKSKDEMLQKWLEDMRKRKIINSL
ncbi:39S ribosomal protein L22, mitochondrial isoform X2 [Cephus cinctus]|nr:39S ribosomal protein L22, mitochondrial isoform X2 [Cephus cinctus]XP_015596831.1 39S ribosomal protein L22, mitochondrial isoform X2 [Cephus cinctus]XP_015596833.1 39S ribosomal protein L22, mitochondrial isoform X2 [Cephus cinctus]XP_015596834.1 39S ribosomal protein L22, mitochondrial isoform X2 [Cephus cinctus]